MKKKGVPLSVLPMYIWTAAFILLPLAYILVVSLLTPDRMNGAVLPFTIENYARIADPAILDVFVRSFRLALETTVICFVVGYPFAYCMARLEGQLRNVIMLLVMIPSWTNSLLRTYGWIILLRGNGLFSGLMTGLTGEAPSLLYTYGATLLGMAYSMLPFMILPAYSSISKLERPVLEAARDLGAGKVRTFFSVTLPLSLPGVLSGCVLVFVPSMGMFFISDLMGGAKVSLLGNLINMQIHTARNLPFAAALSIVMLLFAILFIAVYRKCTGKSELEGIA